jgi:ferredoxin
MPSTITRHSSLVREVWRRRSRVADPNDRVEENAAGTYYVDTQCIDCDVCRDTAPDNFTRSDANGYSYVFKQPENEEERELCEEALAACPVEAIGNDG